MTTDQDLPMDVQSATALFTAKGIDVTPNKDQGVIKIVKRAGHAGDQPMIGDRVTVHYTGRLLNGKKFDCTQDCREPFSFNVYKGQVLKAWDVGVLSMERGEVSIFLCAPEYAYGVTGNPNKIPPNSAVVFEVGAPGQQFWRRFSFSVTQFLCVLFHFLQFSDYLCIKISHIPRHTWKNHNLPFVECISAQKNTCFFKLSTCSFNFFSICFICQEYVTTSTCFSFVYCLFLHPQQH
ncbi:unnamed protein product [Tetraodon nigroviridis]|uniref:peptidylprolyl isomerase n=1 Tax=Tetraodon nigroviridis TaxID=99883 RepID=Q4RXE5_TETNG|nr:unnamed protein product [Tetraodon nigroviridis]